MVDEDRRWSGAVLRGDLVTVEAMLLDGYPVDTVVQLGSHRDGRDYTPLMVACNADEIDFAQLLLDHGADVNQQSFNGWFPLAIAGERQDRELIHSLLESGASVALYAKDGSSGLSQFVEGFEERKRVPEADLQLVERLCAPEVINRVPAYGNPPLHAAAMRGLLDLCRVLLRNGALRAVKNRFGETAVGVGRFGGREVLLDDEE